MGDSLPVLAALGAAALFSLATTLQHRTARAGPAIAGTSRGVGRALAAIVTRPTWLAGLLADVVGFGLHAWALTAGQLAVVQPLLVTGLLFALPLGAALDRRPVAGRDMWWAAGVVAALGLFLTLARPGGGSNTIELGPAAAATLVACGIVAGCLLVARSPVAGRRATALGVLTGLLFGITAALIKAVGTTIGHDPDSLFTSWPTYALLLLGPLGLAVNQVAFQAGPLAASLPAITAVDPLASVVLGVLLFDERLHGGPLSAVAQAVALLAMTVGVLRLARSEATIPDTPNPAAPVPGNVALCDEPPACSPDDPGKPVR